jgi:aspartate/tyrosine/aromatic aminotransferase
MYSNPPIHGAKIVANIVGDPTLFSEWKAEMEMMAGRIKNVRQKLYDSLCAKDKSGKDWSFILKQIGMFSFTGLNKTQVISHSYFYTSGIKSLDMMFFLVLILLHSQACCSLCNICTFWYNS